MPKSWYNIKAVMKELPPPMLHPGTLKPCTYEDLKPVFCDELIEQELNDKDLYIPIPEDLLSFYKMYRPSPLVRAYCLEKMLDTPAEIYYKFEGTNTPAPKNWTRRPPRSITPKNKGLLAWRQKPAPVNGAPPFPWLVLITISTSRSIWSKSLPSKSLIEKR